MRKHHRVWPRVSASAKTQPSRDGTNGQGRVTVPLGGAIEDLAKSRTVVAAEDNGFYYSNAHSIAIGSRHPRATNRMKVDVFVVERIQLIDHEGLVGVRQLPFPESVPPFGMMIPDTEHVKTDKRLEFDIVAAEIGIREMQFRSRRTAGGTSIGSVAGEKKRRLSEESRRVY